MRNGCHPFEKELKRTVEQIALGRAFQYENRERKSPRKWAVNVST